MIIAGATMPTATESEEQKSLFVWATIAAGKYPALNLLFHIPNEGKRSQWTGARMRSEGLKSGVPDLCLPVARSGYHGLYIELKAGKNKPTANQLAWLEALEAQGYKTAVCYGWEAAKNVIEAYLKSGEERNEQGKHGCIKRQNQFCETSGSSRGTGRQRSVGYA